MPEAARQLDQVEHSCALLGLMAGAVIGAAIGAAIVLSGGTAAVALVPILIAMCTGASLGGSIGEIIGSVLPPMSTGPISVPCDATVFINNKFAARVTDGVACTGQLLGAFPHPNTPIAQGSTNVFFSGLPAARKGDQISCGATIGEGSSNVFIGGEQATYMDVESEVPWYAYAILMGLGLFAGVGMVANAARGLRLIMACRLGGGLVGGLGFSLAGSWAGGKIFGEGSLGQRITALGSGIVGGLLGSRVAGSRAITGRIQRWQEARTFPGYQTDETCVLMSSQQIIGAQTGRNYSEAQLMQMAAGKTPGSGFHQGVGSFRGTSTKLLSDQGIATTQQAQTPANVQAALAQGRGVITHHRTGALYNNNKFQGGHTIRPTGVVRDSSGKVTHYIVNDTGGPNVGGASQRVPANQFEGSLRNDWTMDVTNNPMPWNQPTSSTPTGLAGAGATTPVTSGG